MRKIAFILFGHTGSTLPLIKRFLKKGYAVDLYVANIQGFSLDMEGTDCIFTPSRKGIEEISNNNWPRLFSYMESERFKMYGINLYRPFSSVRGLNKVISSFQRSLIKRVCQQVNNKNYSLINIVGRYNVLEITFFLPFIRGNIIVSLHEVCNHTDPTSAHPNQTLNYLFKSDIPIVVFSRKSYNDILKYKSCNKNRVFMINFGTFETFGIFKGENQLLLPKNYFLFIGRITPYKGLNVYFEATKDIMVGDYKFVVAGSGNSPVLDEMRKNPRYVIINRYLKENEFAELIEKSTCVVCPYLSVSQSGIPQTVAVFKKPVVASDLPGFSELVLDGVNGRLVKVGDIIDLRNTILHLIDNESELTTIQTGAAHFDYYFKEYRWDYIVRRYEQYFLS